MKKGTFSGLAQALVDKSLTKEDLLQMVRQDFSLIPLLLSGVDSSKPAVIHGCAKDMLDLSEEHPAKFYLHLELFIDLLDSKYRILLWNALIIIANLTRVDPENKFDAVFGKYYSFLDADYSYGG